MLIQVAQNEQLPYGFPLVPTKIKYAIETKHLPTGDYVVDRSDKGLSQGRSCAVLERKTLSDLYGTLTHGRQRFERELERMRSFGFSAIIIEAELSQIVNPNAHLKHPTKANPKSILGSLLAFQQRFNVHIMPCPGREAAERIAFRILERWYKEKREK